MRYRHGGDIWKTARMLGTEPARIIDFSASINPLGLPQTVRRAIKDNIDLLSAYPDPDMEELKSAFARFHGIGNKNVLPANGSTELIYLIPAALKPKRALIVEPAFSEYRRSLRMCACDVRDFLASESEDFVPDLKRLEKRLDKSIDILYIANPANPTGTALDKEGLLRLADRCRRLGIVLVVDEAFSDFTEENSLKHEAAGSDNIIVLRSMTKFFSIAGLRLGFAVSGKRLLKALRMVQPPWSVNTLAEAAGTAILQDSAFMLRTRRWFQREKVFLSKTLSSIEGLKRFPSDANFFLMKILKRGLDAGMLKDRLLKKKMILIRDMEGFRGLGKRFFRVAVRAREENRLLASALKEFL